MCRRIQTEDANFVGRYAHFAQRLLEAGNAICFHVDEKLIFPGAAVNRAALDLDRKSVV